MQPLEITGFYLYERLTVAHLETILNSLGGESRIDLGLTRFREALNAIGNPEKSVKTIVIGGTNGKGSTALFASNALRRSGLRVGTYLSPHLQDLTERMLIDLHPIDPSDLDGLAIRHAEYGKRFELTYFEFLTLLYFVWAAREQFDISVLEVGLGGRLDATNVTTPVACAITNIDFDHQSYLGNTRELILSEKLGIVRHETPLYTGITDPDLIAQCCKAVKTVINVNSIERSNQTRNWMGQRVSIDGFEFWLNNPSTGTVENSVLAYGLLRGEFPEISVPVIQSAFAEVITPGRFEIVGHTPRVVLSGDHNPHGLKNLFETLERLPSTQLHTLCAFSLDKPYREMFLKLKERSSSIALTVIPKHKDHVPFDYENLAELERDPIKAFESVKEKARPGDTILVTGSLYLVGQVRNYLRQEIYFVAAR